MTANNDRASEVADHASSAAMRGGSEEVDVLSDVLREVRLSGALFFLTDASSPWAVEVPDVATLTPDVMPHAQHLISYHVVTSGSCWCRGPGAREVHLEAGDVVVIPHGDPYVMSQPAGGSGMWPPEEVLTFFRLMARRELPFVVSEGGGGPERLTLLCGFLGCDVLPFNPVIDALPPLLHLPRAINSQGDRLGHLVDFAMEESREPRAGSNSVRLRIAELMFVEVVRRHLASLTPGDTGWLAALRDPIVGRALALLHRRPGRPWTLQQLATASGSSRSALAERFGHLVGTPPMQYLTNWRMQMAARLLRDSDAKLGAVAAAVGYESDVAFSRAFSRIVGVSPGAWRRGRPGLASAKGGWSRVAGEALPQRVAT
jgi:AraC-like DNA-binding protein